MLRVQPSGLGLDHPQGDAPTQPRCFLPARGHPSHCMLTGHLPVTHSHRGWDLHARVCAAGQRWVPVVLPGLVLRPCVPRHRREPSGRASWLRGVGTRRPLGMTPRRSLPPAPPGTVRRRGLRSALLAVDGSGDASMI